MRIELEQKDGICILRLHGRLVPGVDPELLREKAEEIKKLDCDKVLVDIGQVSAIGSTGLGLLVAIYTTATRKPLVGRFVLVGAQPRVKEVLDLTRLSSVIPMAADVASGMAALGVTSATAANDNR